MAPQPNASHLIRPSPTEPGRSSYEKYDNVLILLNRRIPKSQSRHMDGIVVAQHVIMSSQPADNEGESHRTPSPKKSREPISTPITLNPTLKRKSAEEQVSTKQLNVAHTSEGIQEDSASLCKRLLPQIVPKVSSPRRYKTHSVPPNFRPGARWLETRNTSIQTDQYPLAHFPLNVRFPNQVPQLPSPRWFRTKAPDLRLPPFPPAFCYYCHDLYTRTAQMESDHISRPQPIEPPFSPSGPDTSGQFCLRGFF
ncbi:hypothetical protein B0J12DRAFT_702378 [Macrophomina phaseolina]|uniref:Uncharacterized protein n=1 Tax=Macrophomina phaseolina TaxID=35725 RepID=A0ABQ8G1Q4_9PEZI|nr:hypothetical protein B0J12DRAFT_702378 [Macrophomina phaseolina]